MDVKQRLISNGEFEIGDIVTVSGYCYSNKYGGTEIADDEIIECKIIKKWHDYECGWRYWAEPTDQYLLSRKENKPGKENVVYVSQFDIIDVVVK